MTHGLDLFEEREPPPMSPEMFTTLTVARLRARGQRVEGQGRLELAMRSGRELRIANIGEYYRRYRDRPSMLTPLIREFIDSLGAGEARHLTVQGYERVAPRLLPLLVSAREWRERQQAGVRMVVRPLVRDVGVALVVEQEEAVTFVEMGAFEDWHVDVGSAYETALANLGNRAEGIAPSQTGDGAHTVFIDRAQDGFSATRVLLNSRLDAWSRQVPGELILGIPSRGFLIGFSSDNPNLEALAAQVRKDATTDELGLSKDILAYRDRKLHVYRLPNRTPIES